MYARATRTQTGSRDEIEALIDEATQHEVNLGDYSDVLFDCVDMHRPNTALYLIDQGADPEVYARVRTMLTAACATGRFLSAVGDSLNLDFDVLACTRSKCMQCSDESCVKWYCTLS